MKLFSKKLSWIYLAAALTACGGGGDDDGDPEGVDPAPTPPVSTQPPPPPPTPTPTPTPAIAIVVPGNQAQQAYSETLWPVLSANCAGCHSNAAVSAGSVNLPKFADPTMTTALNVLIDRQFIDPDNFSGSRIVSRVRDEQHGCWPDVFSCASNANVLVNAITAWEASYPDFATDLGRPEPVAVAFPEGSDENVLQAYTDEVFPILALQANGCVNCHNGSGGPEFITVDDIPASLDYVKRRELINIEVPEESVFVQRMESGHYCGDLCDALASSFTRAASAWDATTRDLEAGGGGNTAPIARDDSFTANQDIPFTTGSVILNDAVVNGNLGISVWDEVSAQGGQVEDAGAGTFLYTPAEGFVGTDTFSYTILDGDGETATATVTIEVLPSLGIAAVSDFVDARRNAPTVINQSELLANDEFEGVAEVVLVEPRSDAGGLVEFDREAGTITYTPPNGFEGEDRFDYSISNGGAEASAEVTVSINIGPIAVDDGDYTYTGFDLVTLNVLKNDLDLNGDELFVSGLDLTGTQGDVTDNGDGTFTYEPENGVVQDKFDYTVSDGRGGTSTATFTINIVDRILGDDDNVEDNIAVFDDIDDDRFLQSLNQSNPAQEEDAVTATAYYAAIDPQGQRLTRRAFYETNGMLNGESFQVDEEVVYQNANDLGFIRLFRIAVDDTTGVLSSCVQNYATFEIGLAAQQAAFDDERLGLLATVCMETKPVDGQNPDDPNADYFTVFYGYDGNDTRFLDVSLDGRLSKEVPGVCNACHGGKPKSLVNGVYPDGGDTGVRNIPWYVDTFAFEDDPDNIIIGVNAVDVEETEEILKEFNTLMLEYQFDVMPGAKEVIEGSYGGPGLPGEEFDEDFVPDGWRDRVALYRQVVSPFCRACHLQLGQIGDGTVDAIAFRTSADFMEYADRIEELVFDDSTMPLARLTFQRFWDDPTAAEVLARELNSRKLLEGDEVMTPGRALAIAGPSRTAAVRSEVILDGSASPLFNRAGADNAQGVPDEVSFRWVLQRPAGSQAELEDEDAVQTEFLADVAGVYSATLFIDDGDINTPDAPPSEVIINVLDNVVPVNFSRDIAPAMAVCGGCHNDLDNQDSLGFDSTNLPRFNARGVLFDELVEMVDTANIEKSLVLMKASGQLPHGGGVVPGWEAPAGENYQLMLRWIAEGTANR